MTSPSLKRWRRGLLALLISGCGGPDSLLEVPIQKSMPVDLLARARAVQDTASAAAGARKPGGSKLRSAHLVVSVDVEINSVLQLEGRLARRDVSDPRKVGPAEFSVEIDGQPAFSRRLTAKQRRDSFLETVPLSPWTGQKVQLTFRIKNLDDQHSLASWGRIQLDRPEPIQRRPATMGPNLLLISVDTLRADHCSLYGYERDTTPFLQRFGDQSLVFENAVSPASWTLPAMISVLTGLTPPRHGAVQGGRALKASFETLAEIVQDAGLTTIGISANPIVNVSHGFDQGFEEFRGVPWRRAPGVNQIFTSWLEDKMDLQWFAYLHYIDPHDPYDAPAPEGERYIDTAYDGVFTEKKALNRLYFTQNYGLEPALSFGPRDIDFLIDAYDGEIRFWDRHLGNLIEHLEATDLLDRTIVIILSDHGEEFVEHSKFKHGHHLYQESIRVPLLIRHPRLGSGRVERTVETRGVFDAALRLLGLSSSPPEPGDLLATEDSPTAVFAHASYPLVPRQVVPRNAMASVQLADWKLIRHLDSERVELYQLSQDPGEQADVAADHPEIAEPLADHLEGWLAAQAPGARHEAEPIDPETLEQLRALGYLQ